MSAKTLGLFNRLKGDGVFAEQKDDVTDVYVRLDPIALRDNISSLLQVLLRQRTKSGTKNSSLLTDDASACATALANRVVNIVATCIHARESGKECEDGCCAATMALPRLLAELALSCGPVQATTLSGAKRRFVPVLSLNGGDCGIPTGWDKDREEAAAEARSLEAALKEDSSSPIRCRPVAPSLRCAPQALKSGKPALPLVDVTAEAAISTQVSSWWLMQRHGDAIYSPVLPLSALAPLDVIGPILMINPFADSVAFYVDGPGQIQKGLRNNMDVIPVPATCPDVLAACASEVVSVRIAQKVVVDRKPDGAIVVVPAAPQPGIVKSQSGAPPPPPPPQPAAGSRDAASPLFLSSPPTSFGPAAAAVACGELPESSGVSVGGGDYSRGRQSITGRQSMLGPAGAPRASISLSGGSLVRASMARPSYAVARARPSFSGSASGGGGLLAAAVAAPRGDFGTVVERSLGGQTAAEAGVPQVPTPLDEQMWLLFVRHYFYRSLITTDAKRELTWETFIQGCF